MRYKMSRWIRLNIITTKSESPNLQLAFFTLNAAADIALLMLALKAFV